MGFFHDDRSRENFKKFTVRLTLSTIVAAAIFVLSSGLAYALLLNNDLWKYYSGYIKFMEYIWPIWFVMAFYGVRFMKSKDLEDEIKEQASGIRRDTEMLKRVSNRGGME